MTRPLSFLLLAMMLFGMSGCSIFGEEEDETKGWSAQQLYSAASEALLESNYDDAIRYYEILESRYPFGRYALQSQLEIAYAYYKDEEHDSAIAAANRFIKLHPNNPATPYAYYLRGLADFNRNLGFMERFLPTDTSQRDPGSSRDSYKHFAELIKRFPDSEYAEDARLRMAYLYNNLARYQVHVAQYYLDRSAYLAAANRAAGVVQEYPQTPAVKDALVIMVKAYHRLDLPVLAEDAARVLALNEQQQNFAPDWRDLEEQSFTQEIWDYLGLDKK